MLGESSALLSMNLPPHRRQGPTVVAAMPTAPFLRRVSLAKAVVEDSAFREGPAIAANVTNTMRTPIECTLGTTSKDVEIAVLNRWEPQFVVVPLESLNRPRLNVLLPASIATHPERPDSAGKFAAMGLAEIACGDSVAVASRRPANATNAAPELAEIYAYSRASGTVAYARFDETNGAALGRLAAARRSRFFMVHNARYDYPVITELEYVANGPARVSSTDFRSSR